MAELVETFSTGSDVTDLARPAVGSIPAALRRAMVAKFGDFDEYQLAKHDKGKNAKPKVRLKLEI